MKRKLLLAISCLLLPLVMTAQTPTDDTFTVSDLEWDGEDYFFTVSLTGTKNYVGYNLDIFLPAGITVTGGEGYYDVYLEDDGIYPYKGKGSNKTYYHTVSCNVLYDAEGANFMLPAGRCYLTPSGDSSAKSFRFRFDNADGISETLTPPLGEDGRELLYDLSGRRVLTPAHRIYIQGTRKVVIK